MIGFSFTYADDGYQVREDIHGLALKGSGEWGHVVDGEPRYDDGTVEGDSFRVRQTPIVDVTLRGPQGSSVVLSGPDGAAVAQAPELLLHCDRGDLHLTTPDGAFVAFTAGGSWWLAGGPRRSDRELGPAVCLSEGRLPISEALAPVGRRSRLSPLAAGRAANGEARPRPGLVNRVRGPDLAGALDAVALASESPVRRPWRACRPNRRRRASSSYLEGMAGVVKIPESVRLLAEQAQGDRCCFCDQLAAALCSAEPPDSGEALGRAWDATSCCQTHAQAYDYQIAIPQPTRRRRLRGRGRGSGALAPARPAPSSPPSGVPTGEGAPGPVRQQTHRRERISPLGE